MDKAFLKVVFSDMIRVITFPLRLMPIKKNRILFTGLTGGNVYDYSCNPKYLYEYLRDNYPGKYEYVWVVSDPLKYSFLKEEGVRLYKHYTVSSFPMLLTSKVIVTNGSYAPWFRFRKSQYVINTWHGGGSYKKVENKRPDANAATRRRAKLTADNIDLFLASCKEQEDQMIRTTYHYNGEVARFGTPRNDAIVCGRTEEMAGRVREHYKIPEDTKIILYAPTYRKLETPVVFDGDYLIDELEKTGEKWCLLGRYHRYQTKDTNVSVTGDKVIHVGDYSDMQELLCAADVLITDYSSCVWDYSFLKRPCVLYVPDKTEYNENTGFYVGMDRWPFPETYNMEELAGEIRDLMTDGDKWRQYNDGVNAHLKELGSYESGKASKLLAEVVDSVCSSHIPALRAFIKWLVFRVMYPVVYRISALRPTDKKKAVFVENHENYLTDNYELIYRQLKKEKYKTPIHYLLVSTSSWSSIIKRSLKLLWDIGNAGFIFLNESNSLFGSFKLKKSTQMIQLWHACGAFKKWGFSVADKTFGDDMASLKKYSGHRNYTLVPVSGDEVIGAYEEAFGIENKKVVKSLGVSRTDMLFDDKIKKAAFAKLAELPFDIGNRKVVVYLPTFRGSIEGAKGPDGFDIESFGKLSDEMVLLIKNHPFVKDRIDINKKQRKYCLEIIDEMSVDELILAADICITDYSSVVFEYSMLRKPILFYAYDIDSYDMERGFYYPYKEFVPGPVAYDMDALIDSLKNIDNFDFEYLEAFCRRFMSGCDGYATERILKETGINCN